MSPLPPMPGPDDPPGARGQPLTRFPRRPHRDRSLNRAGRSPFPPNKAQSSEVASNMTFGSSSGTTMATFG